MVKKIFIIDDDPSILKILEYRLKGMGDFKVVSEMDGSRGLEAIKKEDFDLIILDIQLPGMNGIDICRELRKIERFKEVPIIAHTALDKCTHEKRFLDVGFNYFLPKLCDIDDFKERIKFFLNH